MTTFGRAVVAGATTGAEAQEGVYLPHGRRALPEGVPEGLKPRLRLFLSVDLIGSTPFKQAHHAWRPEILSFYRNFGYILDSQYREFRSSLDEPLPAPEFWKANGDELLYTWELQSLAHVHAVMNIWLAALAEYRGLKSELSELGVKSTAWIALFPIPNSEVFFRRGPAHMRTEGTNDAVLLQSELRDDWYANGGAGDIIREYVGPSIDTGFRLASLSTPSRMMVSVDLAFLLTSLANWGVAPLPLYLGGSTKLKGVIDNEPYPKIWIPVGDEKLPGLHGERSGDETNDQEVIRSRCQAVIEQNYKSVTPIFLPIATYDDYEWAPPYILKQIADHWREEVRYRALQTEGSAPERQADSV